MAFAAVTDPRFRDDIRPNNTTLLRIPPQYNIRQGYYVKVLQKRRFCIVAGCRLPYGYNKSNYNSDNKRFRDDNINTGGDQKRRRRGGGGSKSNDKGNNKLKDEEYKAPKALINLFFIYIAVVTPATPIAYIATAAAPVIPRDYQAYLATNVSTLITYIFNTGYMNYIVNNSRIFVRRELLPEPILIRGFSGGRSITYIGIVKIPYQSDQSVINLIIYNVLFVPNNIFNLISPRQL